MKKACLHDGDGPPYVCACRLRKPSVCESGPLVDAPEQRLKWTQIKAALFQLGFLDARLHLGNELVQVRRFQVVLGISVLKCHITCDKTSNL